MWRWQHQGQGPQHCVLLPGWGASAGIWQSLLPQLAGWRVSYADWPAMTHPQQYDVEQLVESLLTQLSDASVLCGWSLGGLVALKAALKAPERCRAVLTLGTTPRFLQESSWPHAVAAEALTALRHDLAQRPAAAWRRFGLLQAQGEAQPRQALAQWQAVAGQQAVTQATWQAGLHWLAEQDLRSALSELASPWWAIYGEQDRLVPVAMTKTLTQLAPQAQVELWPGGHLLWRQSQRIAERLQHVC